MSSTRSRAAVFALLCGTFTANCHHPDQPPTDSSAQTSCQQKRALWESEYPKVRQGAPAVRITAIQAIAGKIGEDPERCVADLVGRAIQSERARLVTLTVNDSTNNPVAVYSCSTLSQELKCVGSVADDTAHLAEMPGAQVLKVTSGGRASLDLDASLTRSTARVYTAALAELLDSPRYAEIRLEESGSFVIPPISEPTALFAIVTETESGAHDKFVWLVQRR